MYSLKKESMHITNSIKQVYSISAKLIITLTVCLIFIISCSKPDRDITGTWTSSSISHPAPFFKRPCLTGVQVWLFLP